MPPTTSTTIEPIGAQSQFCQADRFSWNPTGFSYKENPTGAQLVIHLPSALREVSADVILTLRKEEHPPVIMAHLHMVACVRQIRTTQ